MLVLAQLEHAEATFATQDSSSGWQACILITERSGENCGRGSKRRFSLGSAMAAQREKRAHTPQQQFER
jgi:hypothetical protein